MTTYHELFHWLGRDAESVWLEYLAKCAVPVVDLADAQADE